jgi:peptidoglycan/xylan/chitin deacetylase (PgdA/CDA1 family)
MRLFRPCFLAGWFYPEALFRIKTAEKILCLTFDDGPNPDSTPELLEILSRYKISALFFCDGRAAEKYPELIAMIRSKGHLTGNHGYMHLDGWRNQLNNYINDVEIASAHTSDLLFRPPFGRLRLSQYRALKTKYKIVFWDLMAYDFDKTFSSEDSLNLLMKKMRPGSILVFHDNPESTLFSYLPEYIEMAMQQRYKFVLPDFL